MPTIVLHADHLETYELGAFLLTLLADPVHLDDAPTLEVRRILCARALWFEHTESSDAAGTAIRVKPEYLWRDQGTVDREVQRIARRLSERMVAGRMAQFYLLSKSNPDFKLPAGMKRLSLNEVAKFVQEDAGQVDAKNVVARMWRPSRPVVHLCAAAAYVGQQRSRVGLRTGLETFLLEPSHLKEVLALAQVYETAIENDPKFPVKGEHLIRLRLN